MKVGTWSHPFAVTGKYLKSSRRTLTQIRHWPYKDKPKKIKVKGGHFSYLATPEAISEKIKSFLHTEFDRPKFTNVNKNKN